MKPSLWLLPVAAWMSPFAEAQSCKNITIPVTLSALTVALTAKNMYIPPNFDYTDQSAFEALIANPIFNQTLRGTFSIAGVYCPPTTQNAARTKTLQLLLHGIASTKEYWSGLGPPGKGYQGNTYSWIAAANAQGYPVLAIDRLGNGASSHPDPVLVSQLPANVETVHRVIAAARAGRLPGVSTAFSKIIVAGHSFGSITTNALSARYPNDADAIILTGMTQQFATAIPGALATAGLLPAAVFNSDKYASLAVGYLAAANPYGVKFLTFYSGGYDSPIFDLTYATSGTVSIGEGITAALSPVPAYNYKGPVIVIDGKQDGIFCCLTGTPLSIRDCGSGDSSLPSLVRTLYTKAKSFDYLILPNTGHCLHLHYTGPGMFQSAHTWLSQKGF